MKAPHGRKELVQVYGNPATLLRKLNKQWEAANIVSMPLPYLMYYAGAEVHSIRIHRLVVPVLTPVLQQVYNHVRVMVKQEYGFDKDTAFYDAETAKKLRALGLDQYGGAFNFRVIRGTRFTLSCHAYGCAIDIDPAHNAMGTIGRMPAWVVATFEAAGFTWGGRWGRSDPMHLQYASGV